MPHVIMFIPVSSGVGLNSVSLGTARAMERKGFRVNIFKPIIQFSKDAKNHLYRNTTRQNDSSLKISHVESLLSTNSKDELMEEIINVYHKNTYQVDIVLVQGLVPSQKQQYIQYLNLDIAHTLNAEIVFIIAPGADTQSEFIDNVNLICSQLTRVKKETIKGIIINKLNAPVDEQGRTRPDLLDLLDDSAITRRNHINIGQLRHASPLPLLGGIPWNHDLIAIRVIDIAHHLNATIIHEGDIHHRRIRSVVFCSRNIPNMLARFRPGALLVTSADRPEVLIAASLAVMNGVEIGALLLTGGYDIDPQVAALCQRAFATGLPVLMVNMNTWQTSLTLQNFTLETPVDDHERIEKIQEYIAGHIDHEWVDSLATVSEHRLLLSPSAFRYQLTEQARKAGKRIVLPEGNEPRTIKAAAQCAERGIARCVLLGNPAEIGHIALSQGIRLGSDIEILDPVNIRENYVARLVELRKNKGVNEAIAREHLTDNVVLATMMLEQGEVDGMVSGAVHTTANTIRPPLQLIKTAPGASLVSSVFFMLLPDQVYVYGDCAINPDPTAEQLAEIAIQSADSATAFGIDARIAMLSYSTGDSGTGSDVDKVREATRLVREKRPDLIVDGPLQYDAAVMVDVARTKAPDSPVAGCATVFIFPDLNTGNTTYKAVQRSADLISIGPMLQGMRKPVNDLSRGALVDDIVYTIALTAIQATRQ